MNLIAGKPGDDKTIHIWPEPDGDDICICARASHLDGEYVLATITPAGIKLEDSLPEELGFELDEDGRLKVL